MKGREGVQGAGKGEGREKENYSKCGFTLCLQTPAEFS